MGAQAQVEIDFGAFPGTSYLETPVADAAILAGSCVEAALMPAATADHTIGEHIAVELDVRAGDVQAGVGYTIFALSDMGPLSGKFNVLGVWN